ncbi:MAG: helix-turn-helix domain-containing protein, partial [Aurantimicrobium sp.]
MGKNHVIILAITQQKLSYRQAAKQYGVSKSWVHKIHKRYLHEGTDAFRAQSRKPHTSPRRTPEAVRERVLELRKELTTAGLDAGPHTLAEHLAREH